MNDVVFVVYVYGILFGVLGIVSNFGMIVIGM